MPAIQLTNLYVEKLPIPEAGRIDIYDTDTRGLVLRVSSNAVKSWSFVYNTKGTRRRLSLGQYPGVQLKMARRRAREASREVIDRLLAHVPQRSDVTSSVYNRFMYDAEATEAVTKWAAHVAKLTSGLEVVVEAVS